MVEVWEMPDGAEVMCDEVEVKLIDAGPIGVCLCHAAGKKAGKELGRECLWIVKEAVQEGVDR